MEYLMQDLITLLSLIFPDVSKGLNTIGSLALIFGLANAFFGYKIFKMMLSILGFIVGMVIGAMFFFHTGGGNAGSEALTGYILAGGIIFGLIAKELYNIGVFLVVSSMGMLIFFILTQNTQTALLLGIICGIAGVFIQKYIIIISTAFSGGSLAATGLWLVDLPNGGDVDIQAIGLIIGICGTCCQLWQEKGKSQETEGEGWESISGLIKNISDDLNLTPGNVKFLAIKSLLAIPILIGIAAGKLFSSSLFGFGVIAVVYLLVMLQFIRKRKADISPDEFVQKFAGEELINKVLDKNLFVMLTPLFVNIFIYLLADKLLNNAMSVVIALISTAATYYFFFKALPDVPSGNPLTSPIAATQNLNTIRSGKAAIKTADSVLEFAFCSECGTKLPSNAQFCDNCGTAVGIKLKQEE